MGGSKGHAIVAADVGISFTIAGVATVMEEPVVTAAQIAFVARIKNSSDVSENTQNAQAIAKAWRGAVHTLDPDRFQIEALVTPELGQKLDILDTKSACAYEFKVSGKILRRRSVAPISRARVSSPR
jgi:hypothetical protein